MKTAFKTFAFVLLLTGCMMLNASVTVGNYDSGNCYPFMCNDSGTNIGISIDYQQAYAANSFSGPINITSITYEYWPNSPGPAYILGGQYDLYWGYSAVGLNLSGNLPGNYAGSATFLGTGFGGFNYGQFLTAYVNFNYDPGQGDLILEWVVSNQDNVPNGSGNGFNWADYSGSATTRAFCLSNYGCDGPLLGALVTTFNIGTATPEPGTLVMFGSGIIGLAGMLRRKINL